MPSPRKLNWKAAVAGGVVVGAGFGTLSVAGADGPILTPTGITLDGANVASAGSLAPTRPDDDVVARITASVTSPVPISVANPSPWRGLSAPSPTQGSGPDTPGSVSPVTADSPSPAPVAVAPTSDPGDSPATPATPDSPDTPAPAPAPAPDPADSPPSPATPDSPETPAPAPAPAPDPADSPPSPATPDSPGSDS